MTLRSVGSVTMMPASLGKAGATVIGARNPLIARLPSERGLNHREEGSDHEVKHQENEDDAQNDVGASQHTPGAAQ